MLCILVFWDVGGKFRMLFYKKIWLHLKNGLNLVLRRRTSCQLEGSSTYYVQGKYQNTKPVYAQHDLFSLTNMLLCI